jgi:hypothetical protein
MRKFLTKTLIDKHADCGIKVIEIDPTTIVTSEAADQARRRGVTFKHIEQADCHMSENSTCTPEEHAAIRSQVRAAVITQLGFESEMVDRAVDAVLTRMKL